MSEEIVKDDHYEGGLTNEAGMAINVPEVKLIGKTGQMSSDFPKNLGEFVYDGMQLMGESFNIILVGYKPEWEEVIDFEAGVFPKRFATINEAASAGYSDEYTAQLKVKPVASIEFFIEVDKDSDLAAYAPITVGDKAYVASKMKVVSKTSFDGVCAVIDQMRTLGALRNGLHVLRLQITSHLVKGKSNSWYGAKLNAVKEDPKTPDDVKSEIESLFPNLKK